MSTMAMLGLALAVVVGVVLVGFVAFFGLLAYGWWQQIRAGRKEHKAAELSDRAGE